MNRISLFVCLFSILASPLVWAHCQVPCGIYGDERRFAQLLEDTDTIAKAIASLSELASQTDPQSQNQKVRWVVTKEQHAAAIQETISSYFLAQRIKASAENYTDQLQAAHAIIVAAMKTKQNSSPEFAEELEAAILELYRVYFGKEPEGLRASTK